MAETTIQWTATELPDGTTVPGYTFNPWIGCSKVHTGCMNCYAETDFDKRRKVAKWGEHGTRILTSEDNWSKPVRWNREAERQGIRRNVFCSSLADVFELSGSMPVMDTHGEVWTKPPSEAEWARGHWRTADPYDMERDPQGWVYVTLDDIRRELFHLIDSTPWLNWLLLTKRPQHVRELWACDGAFRKNVSIGTSISNQATAEHLLYPLLKLRDLTPCLFVSAEPLLGPIRLHRVSLHKDAPHYDVLTGSDELGFIRRGSRLDWVIVGGESGRDARVCNTQWIGDIVTQCKSSQVPVFVKQLGSRPKASLNHSTQWPHCDRLKLVGDGYGDYAIETLTHSKGGDPEEWPECLRVREFPSQLKG